MDLSEQKKILDKFRKIYSDPDFFRTILNEDRKRCEAYEKKLKYYEDHPDYEIQYLSNGWKGFRKDSPEGKKIRAARIKKEKILNHKKFESENPMESALMLLIGKRSVSRSDARSALDSKNIKFSIERLNEFIGMLEDEGIKIK